MKMTDIWYYLGALGEKRYKYFINVRSIEHYARIRQYINGNKLCDVVSGSKGVIHKVNCVELDDSVESTFLVCRHPCAPGLALEQVTMPNAPVIVYPSMAMTVFSVGLYFEKIVCGTGVFCYHFPHSWGEPGPVFFGDLGDLRISLLKNEVRFMWFGGQRILVLTPTKNYMLFMTALTQVGMRDQWSHLIFHLHNFDSIDMRHGSFVGRYTDYLQSVVACMVDIHTRLVAAHNLLSLKTTKSPKRQRSKKKVETLSPKKKNKKSPRGHYIGSSWHKKTQRWESKIKVKGRTYSLGYFETQEAGAIAYDKFVRENDLVRRTNFDPN